MLPGESLAQFVQRHGGMDRTLAYMKSVAQPSTQELSYGARLSA